MLLLSLANAMKCAKKDDPWKKIEKMTFYEILCVKKSRNIPQDVLKKNYRKLAMFKKIENGHFSTSLQNHGNAHRKRIFGQKNVSLIKFSIKVSDLNVSISFFRRQVMAPGQEPRKRRRRQQKIRALKQIQF